MLRDQNVVCPVIVGRDVPLSTVVHTLDRARAMHGGTLLISGEAGVGKSRLVRAMVERARATGFVALQGACFEADRAQPYAPILDLVRVLSSSASPALAAHYFAPAATELVTLFPELRPIFPDAAPRAVSDPEEERRRLFHSLAEALRALSRVQPLLIVIEDVHWSDDATLDVILHLARSVGSDAIALALTFRSDEIGAVDRLRSLGGPWFRRDAEGPLHAEPCVPGDRAQERERSLPTKRRGDDLTLPRSEHTCPLQVSDDEVVHGIPTVPDDESDRRPGWNGTPRQ